eukprot:jgi/Astpho2/1075/e_gw1.00017.36.1_t
MVRPVHQASDLASSTAWRFLGTPSEELRLEYTLPTGQSFRWRDMGEGLFTGVIGKRVVEMQQTEQDVLWRVVARGQEAAAMGDAAALADYFNLGVCLAERAAEWARRDERFSRLRPFFPGARVLRQDLVECLFEFICSSNNHISRIKGMVERLCQDYGTPLTHLSAASSDLAFHAFPSIQQLSEASEDALRAQGFGYRAKFITSTVQQLLQKPQGGEQWLQGLRGVPYAEAVGELCSLCGVGPKVAACICLFSLDKQEAIPVDTHVWQLAKQHYMPHLKGQLVDKKMMAAVEQAFQQRFGMDAGWAHNVLFISDLASQQERLPPELQAKPKAAKGARSKTAKASSPGPAADAVPSADVSSAAPAALGSSRRTAGGSARQKRKQAPAAEAVAGAESKLDASETSGKREQAAHAAINAVLQEVAGQLPDRRPAKRATIRRRAVK